MVSSSLEYLIESPKKLPLFNEPALRLVLDWEKDILSLFRALLTLRGSRVQTFRWRNQSFVFFNYMKHIDSMLPNSFQKYIAENVKLIVDRRMPTWQNLFGLNECTAENYKAGISGMLRHCLFTKVSLSVLYSKQKIPLFFLY